MHSNKREINGNNADFGFWLTIWCVLKLTKKTYFDGCLRIVDERKKIRADVKEFYTHAKWTAMDLKQCLAAWRQVAQLRAK